MFAPTFCNLLHSHIISQWMRSCGRRSLTCCSLCSQGTVTFPGMPAKDLLASADLRSSPALARSPLMTMNTSPSASSPYAKRFVPDDPMRRGNERSNLTEKLVVTVR